MRASLLLVFLPFIAACEPEPVPQPEPREADPVVVKQETQRRELLSGAARPGDFKANFGEPFIQFENRGSRMAISQSYADPGYRVIDVTRSGGGETVVFRAREGAVPGDSPFVLTIEKGACTNEFSLEKTEYRAFLGTEAEPRRIRSCAAPAK